MAIVKVMAVTFRLKVKPFKLSAFSLALLYYAL